MNNDIKIVYLEPNQIKPYIRNARYNDVTVQKLCEIISKVGFNQPIVIDKDNVIVKGHSRWKAAIKLGLDKIPCIVSENDEETNKFDRLADNKVQEFSKWNEEILNTELASINIDDIDLEDFGFDLDFNISVPKFEEPQAPIVETLSFDSSISSENVSNNNIESQAPTYVPNDDNNEEFITEKDIMKTVATNENDYGAVTCQKCGQVVLYKK